MSRFLPVVSATVVAAMIAALTPGPAQAQESNIAFGRINLRRDEGRAGGTIPASRDSVFAVVAAFLEDLRLKAKTDPAAGRLLADRQRLVGRLGKQPVSRYLACGSGLLGPNADTWHVYYTLDIGLTPATPATTNLALTFTAEAIDTPNGRSEKIPCRTTGELELALVRRLDSALAR